ncbi:baseplate J/gp47 family protein [Calothrix sp. FACHB-156]|nr:baseplate J/gp47 family protein [Calothrix sp. FACHB-156]
MSLQPPKIDQRSYDEIVNQTVRLAQHFTVLPTIAQVNATPEELRDRTLAEDIKDESGNTIAKAGSLIDSSLATTISNITGLQKVKVQAKGWWKTRTDVGLALIRIFARMVALVSDRLNQVPEKHFLAFLDLIGTQIQPPQPAKVPLTFYLPEGSPTDIEAFVPLGTQVAAPTAEGQEEVVFETEQNLVVTTTELQAVYVCQPDVDCYSDRTLSATGQNHGIFSVFEAAQPIDHFLYVAIKNPLVVLPGNKTLTLTFDSPQIADLAALFGEWSYWDGITWRSLSPNPTLNTSNKQVEIRPLPDLKSCTINGQTAPWLRVMLNGRQFKNQMISRIQSKVIVTDGMSVQPDGCLFNNSPLDLNKDFYPFGEQPRFNDTLYIASATGFATPGASVTLTLTLSTPASGNISVVWETWDGQQWLEMTPIATPATVNNWTSSGTIRLTLPSLIAPTTINGESNNWIRSRINQWTYAKSTSVVTATNLTEASDSKKPEIKVSSVRGFMPGDRIQILGSGDSQESVTIKSVDADKQTLVLNNALTKSYPVGSAVLLQAATNALVQPPVIKTLKITAFDSGNCPLAACVSLNNFVYVDCLTLASFQPFTPVQDQQPTLYLGFDKPFPNRAIALYLQVAPPNPEDITPPTSDSTVSSAVAVPPPRLVWEYRSTKGWATLNVQDGTAMLSQRGLIRFIAPSDFQAETRFARTQYWLRVRWENYQQSSRFRVKPRLQGVLTNTVWATQAVTLVNENLGSSDGSPNQSFYSVQAPILLGQQLEVSEPTLPSADEQVAIALQSGQDALTIVRDETGQIESIWVCWQEVPDFYGSTSGDRHYILNRLTGEIRFGDGRNGMVPPQGLNNIRLAHYRSGGGVQGNQAAATITQLKTTVPYINSVTNFEPATGGSDQESLAHLQERGPKSLRHRGRAVTAQDFEDLACEASPDVARVQAIVPMFLLPTTTTSTTTPTDSTQRRSSLGSLDPDLWLDPQVAAPNLSKHNAAKPRNIGQVQLIIVPDSTVSQPIPSVALIEQVEAYIKARCSPTLQLWVGGPQWVQVTVTATVVPISLDVADVLKTLVIQRLQQFLHSLTGGVDRQGWAFGREPHESDIYAVIESIEQVDYVRSLSLDFSPKSLPDNFLIFSGNHLITLG